MDSIERMSYRTVINRVESGKQTKFWIAGTKLNKIADAGKAVASTAVASSDYYSELSISFNVTVDDFEVFRDD